MVLWRCVDSRSLTFLQCMSAFPLSQPNNSLYATAKRKKKLMMHNVTIPSCAVAFADLMCSCQGSTTSPLDTWLISHLSCFSFADLPVVFKPYVPLTLNDVTRSLCHCRCELKSSTHSQVNNYTIMLSSIGQSLMPLRMLVS